MPRDRVEVEVLTHTNKSNASLKKYLGLVAAATAAAYGLKKIVIDNAKAGLKYAGSMDALSASFRVLLRSGSEAEMLMESLQQFAATTPFQMEKLAQATKVLINTGTDVSRVTDVLESLGNAAMGNAEVMDRLVDAYSKLQTKGRASLEELNRFLEAGVPILDELQKSLGVTKDELFAMISAGKVQFAEVNKALENLTTGQGRLAGLIKVQSETLPGLLSTLRDVVDQMRGGFMEAFLPALKAGLQKLIGWLQKAAENIKSWAETNQATIYAIFTKLPDIVKAVMETVVSMINTAMTGTTMVNVMKVFGQYIADAMRLGISTLPFMFKTILSVAEDVWRAFGDNAGKYIINGIVNAILTGPRWATKFVGWLTGNETLEIGRVDFFGVDTMRDMEEFKGLIANTFEEAGLTARRMVAQNMTNWADSVKEIAGLFDDDLAAGAEKVNALIEDGKAAFEEWKSSAEDFGVATVDATAAGAEATKALIMSQERSVDLWREMIVKNDELEQSYYDLAAAAAQAQQKAFEEMTSDLFGWAGDYLDVLRELGVAEEKLFQYKKAIALVEATIGMLTAIAKATTVWEKVAALTTGLLAIAKIGYEQPPPPPSFASGGIVAGPITATVGDAGPMRTGAEAIVPLDRYGDSPTVVVHVYGTVISDDQLQGVIVGTVREMQRGY